MKAKENKNKIGIGTVLKNHSILLDSFCGKRYKLCRFFPSSSSMWLHSSDWRFSKSFARSQSQIKNSGVGFIGRGKQKVSIKEDLDEES